MPKNTKMQLLKLDLDTAIKKMSKMPRIFRRYGESDSDFIERFLKLSYETNLSQQEKKKKEEKKNNASN